MLLHANVGTATSDRYEVVQIGKKWLLPLDAFCMTQLIRKKKEMHISNFTKSYGYCVLRMKWDMRI